MSREERIARREAARTDATGYGGAISCRSQIQSALSLIRERVGEGVAMRISWDRTGKQEFPIYGGKSESYEWPAIDIFGSSGRFTLSAKGSPNLPIDAIGLGYRIEGDDITIDIDPVVLKGLAAKISKPASAAGASSPSGSPLMIAWTIFSIVQFIVAIFRTHAELLLGGNVSLEAVLNGDTLTVKFSQCPAVRLTMYWEFRFDVPSIVVTPEKVTVALDGDGLIASRIKSREFAIE